MGYNSSLYHLATTAWQSSNADAAAHILTFGYELPTDLLHYASSSSELAPWLGYGETWRTLQVKVRENTVDPWINRYPWLRQIYEKLGGPQRALFLTVEGWFQIFPASSENGSVPRIEKWRLAHLDSRFINSDHLNNYSRTQMWPLVE